MDIASITLTGRFVELQPLNAQRHLADLCAAGLGDEALWHWVGDHPRTEADMASYIAAAERARDAGAALPFAIIARKTGRAVGSTRFAAIEPDHRRLEIGWTWVGAPWQRTALNTEAKLLLLTHAFETLGCIRVELKTDRFNLKSRRAIERLGATEEGTFRRHMIIPHTGRLRDTVYYSLLDDEWPAVKTRLQQRLN